MPRIPALRFALAFILTCGSSAAAERVDVAVLVDGP